MRGCPAMHGCIASSFYIKPQRSLAARTDRRRCIASSFYIKPQHKTKKEFEAESCIASSFYIKPQRKVLPSCSARSCIASSFYIKPQQKRLRMYYPYCCIASSFYIKPQREQDIPYELVVVLHPLSTSNHNYSISKISAVRCIASSFYIKPQPRTPDTLIFGHLTASRHDTKRGGVHRGSRFDAVFTFSTNIRKIIFTEIRRCMSVQRAGARLRSDSSEANI